ncbi:hypothetical protein L1765_12155 [Microaerobacter geothermalis]|uniref:hypothetical protein n=1 Tax=Microaerobacter geothermalis TaxID=674972 RepID=UPI001F30D9EE|nr:hypothetical protein [Microaerobacter geothermalis]MCF6094714.1 hypothetical protein [Microaerobacter geothermalis]
MKKTFSIFLLLSLVFGLVQGAFAHISNELEIYKDIADSPAKADIVKLRALGIIPFIEGQENFDPSAELDKLTLATWLAKAANVKGHTENPTPKEYAEEAVEYGFIDNLEGEATLPDVVTGLLKIQGVKKVTEPAEQAEELGYLEGEWHDLVDAGGIATKENAAKIISMALSTKGPSGKSILDILGVKEGPTGKVTDVKEENEQFTLTFDNQTIPFYKEGKIALFESMFAAKDNQVVLSYLKTVQEEGKEPQDMLIYIEGDGSVAGTVEAAAEQTMNSEEQKPESTSATTETIETEKNESNQKVGSEQEATNIGESSNTGAATIWTIVIVLLLIVGIWVYLASAKKKQHH